MAAPTERPDRQEPVDGATSAITRAILGDGSAVHVRPIAPDDKQLLSQAFERLSPDSRYSRFLHPLSRLSSRDLAYFTEVDHHRHEALVAIDPHNEQLLGVARYVQVDEPATAEVAVAVADDWHGRGLGTLLLHELVSRARENGIRWFTATCLSANADVIDLLGRLGTTQTAHPGPGYVDLKVELPAEPESSEALLHALRAVAAGRLSVHPTEN